MPAHIGSSSPSAPGRSYNVHRPTSPSRIALVTLGLASIMLAVYFAETYPKRVVHTNPRMYQIGLPYDLYALEPHISSETMDLHYNKHDYGYDRKLQSLVNNSDLAYLSLWELLERNSSQSLPVGIMNNAGQLMNHNIFWESMTPDRTKQYPNGLSDYLRDRLVKDFGSLDAFAKEFENKATSLFGSGWVFVVFNLKLKYVQIFTMANGNYPSPPGEYAVLFNCDVWEHAYYVDYRNRRDEYIRNFWSIVNWNYASEQYQKALAV